MPLRAALLLVVLLPGLPCALGEEGLTVRVSTRDALTRAVADARPGQRILVAPGTYAGGLAFAGLKGQRGKPIVIRGEDAARPPLFEGGGAGIQLSDAEHVELGDLAFSGQTGNGVNVDDAGTPETPTHHVVLRRLTVRDVGPRGNHDGIKLSGLEDFTVEDATVERWGTGGSAVDLVGCRRGTIQGCRFIQAEGASDGSGVQLKGGTREVAVRRNRFEHAGSRAVNAGGSTGPAYFRPPLAAWGKERFEARDLTIEGNTFVGSQAPVAFVGVDGAVFRFNTVYRPGRWALRILQETREPGFVPSRGGRVTDNVIVFRSDRWAEGGVNVGSGTEPASFQFERNVWTCEDAPERSRELVRLPSAESGGSYGLDPLFRDAAAGDLRLKPGSRAAKAGAEALPK